MSFFAKKLFFFVSLTCLFSCAYTTPIHAQTPPDLKSQITRNINTGSNAAGIGKEDPRTIIAGVIKVLLSIVGITFTILIVYSGYTLLTAAGDESKVEKAKKTITAAVIGLSLTLGAYSLTSFIGRSAVHVTNEQPQDTNDGLHWRELRDDVNNGLFEDTGNNVE